MAETFELEIVTPERLVVKETVEEAQVPAKNGYIGVLAGHAPLITELAIGEITFKSGGTVTHLALAWGFAEILPTKTTILAESAERAEEIDVARAQDSKARAEKFLTSNDPSVDQERALKALKRAEVRLQVAQYAGVPR